MRRYELLLLLVMSTSLLSCGVQQADKDDAVSVAVIDLEAVSSAMGEGERIEVEMNIVNADLKRQLDEVTADLNRQLAERKQEYGPDISVEESQVLQELLLNANKEQQRIQNLVNLKSQEHRKSLILDWRSSIQPVIEEVAGRNEASIVMVEDVAVIWFDDRIDITDEVIAELRGEARAVDEKSRELPQLDTSGDMI